MKPLAGIVLLTAAALLDACSATTPPAPIPPASAPLETDARPDAHEPGSPTAGPDTEKSCSVWSGGPLGDAPPPEGYDPEACGPDAHCVCMAQAGYSCSGTCQPK